MPSHIHKDPGSARMLMTMRQFIILSLIPVLLFMIGVGFFSYRMIDNIENHTNALARSTVSNVFHVQRGAVNLECLRFSLASLVEAHDHESARNAYINAWKLLSDSTLDRHEKTKQKMEELLETVRGVWEQRQNYEMLLSSIREHDRMLFDDLLNAAAIAKPVDAEDMPQISFQPMRHEYLEYDESIHQKQIKEFEDVYDKVCTNNTVAAISPRCHRMERIFDVLGREINDLSAIRGPFEKQIALMKKQTLALRTEYSVTESDKLLSEIHRINDIASPAIPFAVLLTGICVMLFGILFVWFYVVMKPIMILSEGMNRFLEHGTMPTNPNSRIIEIDRGISWIMKSCEQSNQNRDEKHVIEAMYSRLMTESARDTLTGVLNRKALREFIHHNPVPHALTGLMMIDIDFFKKINDTRGHPFGDKILEALGHALKENLSERDHIFRYGGEEFCVVMTGVTPAQIRIVADRLLGVVRRISRKNASISPDCAADDPLTISIGLSTVLQIDGEKNFDDLIHEADIALYAAKNAGRDRSMAFDESMIEVPEMKRSGPDEAT